MAKRKLSEHEAFEDALSRADDAAATPRTATRDERKKQLEIELQKIKCEEELEHKEELARRGNLCLSNIDFLLAMVPTHDCRLCSDENFCNEDRCRRCAFLEAKNNHYWSDENEVYIQVINNKRSNA